MPKSQFDKSLTVAAGKVTVSGVVDPDTDAKAKESGTPVEVLWMVEQGDVVAHGHGHAVGTKFSQEDGDELPWKAGRARVSGITVTVAMGRPSKLASFEWQQEVELKV